MTLLPMCSPGHYAKANRLTSVFLSRKGGASDNLCVYMRHIHPKSQTDNTINIALKLVFGPKSGCSLCRQTVAFYELQLWSKQQTGNLFTSLSRKTNNVNSITSLTKQTSSSHLPRGKGCDGELMKQPHVMESTISPYMCRNKKKPTNIKVPCCS